MNKLELELELERAIKQVVAAATVAVEVAAYVRIFELEKTDLVRWPILDMALDVMAIAFILVFILYHFCSLMTLAWLNSFLFGSQN